MNLSMSDIVVIIAVLVSALSDLYARWSANKAKEYVGGYLVDDYNQQHFTPSTTAFRPLRLSKTLKYCPGLVDHYNADAVRTT
jgi:hypothetical protein